MHLTFVSIMVLVTWTTWKILQSFGTKLTRQSSLLNYPSIFQEIHMGVLRPSTRTSLLPFHLIVARSLRYVNFSEVSRVSYFPYSSHSLRIICNTFFVISLVTFHFIISFSFRIYIHLVGFIDKILVLPVLVYVCHQCLFIFCIITHIFFFPTDLYITVMMQGIANELLMPWISQVYKISKQVTFYLFDGESDSKVVWFSL